MLCSLKASNTFFDLNNSLISFHSAGTYTSSPIEQSVREEPWLPKSGTITVSFTLHMNVPAGDYEVLLLMADKEICDADYNIIMLNKDVVEMDAALNNLKHKISVSCAAMQNQ